MGFLRAGGNELTSLSSEQKLIVNSPVDRKIFLFGPGGSGKTTAGVLRLLNLVQQGVPGENILILVPQRTLARPYYDLLRSSQFPAGGNVDVATLGGLAQRMIALFWPLIASQAGFGKPTQPPAFLTLETAQYFMARLVKPLLDQGYFETIHLDHNRLFSQILDNLNKAAAVGFDAASIGDRLSSAWIGKPEQTRAYADAQDCANRFRAFCLENNLLDFSLQLEIFIRYLWPSNLCREYLTNAYRHLIFDNVEEDVPVVHDLIAQWLPNFESALLIYDTEGGYRSFLGADPESGWTLQQSCDQVLNFTENWVNSPEIDALRDSFIAALHRQPESIVSRHIENAYQITHHKLHPELLDWISDQVAVLVNENKVPPDEIAILSPFLSDSLRFSLMERFNRAGISARSHRPSRSLREEPATHCLLTFARLAHPQWGLPVTHFDVRLAFMQAIQDLDLTRADILAKIVFRPNWSQEGLVSFSTILPDMQQRITYILGQRYEELRAWVEGYRQDEPAELDIFLSRIFGEVLSQPGFGFHLNYDSAGVAAQLIESVQKFRWATSGILNDDRSSTGQEYIQMVLEGVIAAQYLQPWQEQSDDAVFIAPAYTFLMANRPVRYQFWLDIGSMGWWERLYQPLTHPVVLNRHWPAGRQWTDADEYAANQQSLERLISGLVRRCGEKIFLCAAGMNERGEEPRGPLLQAIQTILRRSSHQGGGDARQA